MAIVSIHPTTDNEGERHGGFIMFGIILQVVDGGSLWLLVVGVDGRIVDQPVEPRFLVDIIRTENLASPYDLVGRDIELAEDEMSIGLP